MRRPPRLRGRGLSGPAMALVALCVVAALTASASVYVVATDAPYPVPGGLSFVRTGGYATRYEAWGAPSAHPVVLVHGAFESVATWRPVARRLAAGEHVEAYDLEGYGYTDHVGPYTTESLATQLAGFLAARQLSHPVLVGHSLGAGVIARFVLDHPGVAAGVVFVDGDGLSVRYPGTWVPGAVPDPFRTAAYRAVVRNRALLTTIFGLACGPDCPTLTAAQLDDVQHPLLVAGAEEALVAYASRPVVGVSAAELVHVRSPSLAAAVVFGAEDAEYPATAPAVTAARIGASTAVRIADCGHLSLWSHPAQVAAVVQGLVDRLATDAPAAGQSDQGSSAVTSTP